MPEENSGLFANKPAAFQMLYCKTADGDLPFPANTIHRLNSNRNLLVRQLADLKYLRLNLRHIPIYFLRSLPGYVRGFPVGVTNHGNPVRHSIEEAGNRSTYPYPLSLILRG